MPKEILFLQVSYHSILLRSLETASSQLFPEQKTWVSNFKKVKSDEPNENWTPLNEQRMSEDEGTWAKVFFLTARNHRVELKIYIFFSHRTIVSLTLKWSIGLVKMASDGQVCWWTISFPMVNMPTFAVGSTWTFFCLVCATTNLEVNGDAARGKTLLIGPFSE